MTAKVGRTPRRQTMTQLAEARETRKGRNWRCPWLRRRTTASIALSGTTRTTFELSFLVHAAHLNRPSISPTISPLDYRFKLCLTHPLLTFLHPTLS
jgi:hypothetical protein